ncbi:MAG: redox-sensing transcriptional repressor Rex [Clostridia bacterium]|nr:redox-sensing transcriptional repressor Rex [Clostridia bacterium]
MAKATSISMSVIRRLPRYYRFLGDLERKGITRISSAELSDLLGLTASQIRQDLNCFGGFGQQGYGYSVKQLREEIMKILGLDHPSDAILIGAGNMGRALVGQLDFAGRGVRLIAVFDNDPALFGRRIGDYTVRSMDELDEFCKGSSPKMAVVAVPRDNAPEVVDRLLALGIRAFWNFSHYDIPSADTNVIVENVHLGDSLMTLSYRMKAEASSKL